MTDKTTKIPEIGGESKRLDPFIQGIKEGAIKKGVDKVSEKVSLPVAEAINDKLRDLHPNMALTAPMVQSSMQAIIILGFAELLDIAGPRIPGEMMKKADLGSRFMRKYAGEKVGSDVVEYAAQFLPVIMAAFSEISEGDLLSALGDEVEAAEEHQEEMEKESPVGDLFLDENEDNELFNTPEDDEPEVEEVKAEPVVAQVVRRPRKKRVSKSS